MVEVNGLTKRYGRFTAVQDVSFSVQAGESFALLGPNGSGKTTILKCLAGLVFPGKGTIRINGVDLGRGAWGPRAAFSYLPQRVGFNENLTAREVLFFYCRVRALPLDRIDRVLAELGYPAFEDKPVRELSGGMVQRLGIAVALLPNVPLLLLDEPAVSVDPEGALRFREVLQSLNRAGRTIIFSSHVLSDVELLAGRVAVLVAGRIVAIRPAQGLENGFGPSARLRVCLRRPGPDVAAVAVRAGATDAQLVHDILSVSCKPEQRLSVLRALEGVGAHIQWFSTEEPSLEEVYLRYVNENNASAFSGGSVDGLRRPPSPAG